MSGPLAGKTQIAVGWNHVKAASFTGWCLSWDDLKAQLALSPGGPTCGLSTWLGFSQQSSWAPRGNVSRGRVYRVSFLRDYGRSCKILFGLVSEVTWVTFCCILLLQVSHQDQPTFKGRRCDWSSWWRSDRSHGKCDKYIVGTGFKLGSNTCFCSKRMTCFPFYETLMGLCLIMIYNAKQHFSFSFSLQPF